MNTTEVYWSLAKPTESKKIDGLTYLQAHFFVTEILVSERQLWKVWREGLDDWISLLDCPELTQPQVSPGRVSPPLAPKSGGDFSMVQDLAAVSGGVDVDNRLSRRFIKSFLISLESTSGEAFSTESIDVSMTGMRMKDEIPETFGNSFNLRLTRSDGEQLKVYCKVIKASGRKRVKFLDVDRLRVLQSWLIDSKTN
jgi:hypothetical protein